MSELFLAILCCLIAVHLIYIVIAIATTHPNNSMMLRLLALTKESIQAQKLQWTHMGSEEFHKLTGIYPGHYPSGTYEGFRIKHEGRWLTLSHRLIGQGGEAPTGVNYIFLSTEGVEGYYFDRMRTPYLFRKTPARILYDYLCKTHIQRVQPCHSGY